MTRAPVAAVLAFALVAAGCGSNAAETAASCDPQSILPVVQAAIDNEATKLHIATAEVRRCRKGYAEVAAVPDNGGCTGTDNCFDTAQVFLRKVNGKWHVLNVGTGITCENEQDPGFRRACRALGYPG
jgi:hypothetical protein